MTIAYSNFWVFHACYVLPFFEIICVECNFKVSTLWNILEWPKDALHTLRYSDMAIFSLQFMSCSLISIPRVIFPWKMWISHCHCHLRLPPNSRRRWKGQHNMVGAQCAGRFYQFHWPSGNKNPHSWGQSVIIKLVLSSPPSFCWLALIYIYIHTFLSVGSCGGARRVWWPLWQRPLLLTAQQNPPLYPTILRISMVE